MDILKEYGEYILEADAKGNNKPLLITTDVRDATLKSAGISIMVEDVKDGCYKIIISKAQ